MPLTNTGRDHISRDVSRIASLTAFDAANAHIGVGDNAGAFVKSQTDLQAATNKLRKPMMATYPLVGGSDDIILFRSSYGLTEGNFNWNEFGIFNAAAAGSMLLREVPTTLGLKPSSEVWELTMTVTYSNP